MDPFFQAERLILEERRKKDEDTSDSDTSFDTTTEDDGYDYVEKFGVSNILIFTKFYFILTKDISGFLYRL